MKSGAWQGQLSHGGVLAVQCDEQRGANWPFIGKRRVRM